MPHHAEDAVLVHIVKRMRYVGVRQWFCKGFFPSVQPFLQVAARSFHPAGHFNQCKDLGGGGIGRAVGFQSGVELGQSFHIYVEALASEIIEALDWRATHGRRFPVLSNCLARADRDIVRMADTLGMTWPLDFNRPEIATLVMKYALQKFQIEFNRGIYRTTIRRVTESISDKKYIPNDQCGFPFQDMLFCPESDMWAPMWSFNSLRGRVNPWMFADAAMRKKLLGDVDNFVEIASGIAGKKPPFLQNVKIR